MRGLVVFLACVLLGTVPCQWLLLRTGEPITAHRDIVLLLMWMPALASLVARLWMREGLQDVSFKLRWATGARPLLLAWLYPLAVGFVAYGAAWLGGLEGFAPPTMARIGLAHAGPAAKLAASLALNLTLGTILSALSAAGEEIGWRGYMLTRLVDAGVRRPVLTSGILWALWHVPLILSGQYAAGSNPYWSALMFTFNVTATGCVIARVRLESGSVWPAIVLHSSWNALIQGTFERFTVGGDAAQSSTLWTGESGVLVAVVNILCTIWLTYKPWPARRHPAASPTAHLRLLEM